jgi:hypothetical integral membrane protein (TIGR02206 family)
MIDLWSEDVEYIRPFDMDHIIYIGILIITLFLMLKNYNYVKINSKNIGNIILGISIFQQILLYSWYFLETDFDLSEALPLHICRISTLLGIYFLITKNTKVLDLIFYFGLFAYGSFLYPSRVYPIYHAIGISFLINHAVTLLLPYFGYIAFGWRTNLKGLIKSYIFFLFYFVFVYFLNPLIDGNYFYLKYRPFFKNWPEYIYVPTLLVFTLVIYIFAYRIVSFITKHNLKRELTNE